MKKIILIIAIACLHTIGLSQTNNKIKDGLYTVTKIIKDTTVTYKQNSKEAVIRFNKLFIESAPDSAQALLIDTRNFVPLELETQPVLLSPPDANKKLQLSFSKIAADQLQKFTAANIMKQVTLVVDGEALTVHKIRVAITGGQMEISRCGDNACEHIYIRLKENVKH